MKKRFSIVKKPDGKWATKAIGSGEITGTYRTRTDAIRDAKAYAKNGATVIVHGSRGEINYVIGPQRGEMAQPIKSARVKRKRTNRDVNVAIAKALEHGKLKDAF